MKNNNIFLVVGQISLAVSILLNHFVKENEIVSFIIGVLTGLALVLNTAFLINRRKIKVNDIKKYQTD